MPAGVQGEGLQAGVQKAPADWAPDRRPRPGLSGIREPAHEVHRDPYREADARAGGVRGTLEGEPDRAPVRSLVRGVDHGAGA
eukprot:4971073-Alexandrium_andersonii.AAC.1